MKEKENKQAANQSNYYDEHNNLIMQRYWAGETLNCHIYKHTYDQDKKILKTIEYHNNTLNHITEYIYKDDKLIERKEYTTKTLDRSLKLASVHSFTYTDDHVEEKVCLPSGDISYYKIHKGDKAKLLNPFYKLAKWTLDSIEGETFTITIKEDILTANILNDIIKNLHKNYPTCRWVIVSAFTCHTTQEENEKISVLLKTFEKDWDIRVDFG